MHDLCILWYHVLKGSGFRGFAANDDDDPFQICPHFQPASLGVSNWGASYKYTYMYIMIGFPQDGNLN